MPESLIISLGRRKPELGEKSCVFPGAALIGEVYLGERVNVWFSAVLRGDLEPIIVGAETNIQDGAVLHVDRGYPLIIGRKVTVGHGAVLHGCTVGDGALIGMGATVLNGADVGAQAVLAAGALLPEGKRVPPRSLAMGVPARVVRELSPEELESLRRSSLNYLLLAEMVRASLP